MVSNPVCLILLTRRLKLDLRRDSLMARAKKPASPKDVEAFRHEEASRLNIPTAEFQSIMREGDKQPVRVAYERRNRDLDPQLVWRGKDEQDTSDLVVHAPPLYIQEKIHPKALIDDLVRETAERRAADEPEPMPDLFADFNNVQGGPDAATDFYRHAQNWSNRMILGDSLAVMASLAEREGLRGKVQCIYLDPPYGIKFNSNFQWSTTSRDVKDGKADHITREPEQVKAFRDTWRDGIHSYLTYLRDRLTVARDLLTESGSIFVQIGDENVHRVRALMDEVFGEDNFICQISTKTSGGSTGEYLPNLCDFIIWYSKNKDQIKFRRLNQIKKVGGDGADKYNRLRLADLTSRPLLSEERQQPERIDVNCRVYRLDNMTSQSVGRDKGDGAASWFEVRVGNVCILPNQRVRWKTNQSGMARLQKSQRIELTGNSISYVRYIEDFAAIALDNTWDDIGGVQSRADPKVYVVQSPISLIQRCILMSTDPGDLVLDPTCGSGTTAYVAEQWGRRWITIDTSRVALALARARLTGARYPYYLLADSPEGQRKEAEVTRSVPKSAATRGDIRQGFVYERVPHITLKSIANNAEIDVIWDKFQEVLEPLRATLNEALGEAWEEWEIPREAGKNWPKGALEAHKSWWEQRIARQKAIDASIAAKADTEYLYDKPYADPGRVRVAGPFTVESLSPHRTLAFDENDELHEPNTLHEAGDGFRVGEGMAIDARDFSAVILEQLRSAGVQYAHKEDHIRFTSLTGWPGEMICAEGRFQDSEDGPQDIAKERRAGILIGPEFGTVAREDLVRAAREAGDAAFDVVIACAFNFDAHASDFEKLGRLPVIKARMNPDLHMADDLKKSKGDGLFVVFGEPDIEIRQRDDDQIEVELKGVDVFHPTQGKVVSSGPDEIAIWFIDTDYNEESFFVRHAYFPGTSHDPMKALKTTLKAEIDAEAWASLNRTVSRPFARPKTGRIAVKVINHLGDEVMKVFGVR